MQGISILATIVSVFSCSLACIVLLYPGLSRFHSRWKGGAFYGSLAVGTLLVAALTGPDPAFPKPAWSWVDWTVMVLGGGTGLAMVAKRQWRSREHGGSGKTRAVRRKAL